MEVFGAECILNLQGQEVLKRGEGEGEGEGEVWILNATQFYDVVTLIFKHFLDHFL